MRGGKSLQRRRAVAVGNGRAPRIPGAEPLHRELHRPHFCVKRRAPIGARLRKGDQRHPSRAGGQRPPQRSQDVSETEGRNRPTRGPLGFGHRASAVHLGRGEQASFAPVGPCSMQELPDAKVHRPSLNLREGETADRGVVGAEGICLLHVEVHGFAAEGGGVSLRARIVPHTFLGFDDMSRPSTNCAHCWVLTALVSSCTSRQDATHAGSRRLRRSLHLVMRVRS